MTLDETTVSPPSGPAITGASRRPRPRRRRAVVLVSTTLAALGLAVALPTLLKTSTGASESSSHAGVEGTSEHDVLSPAEFSPGGYGESGDQEWGGLSGGSTPQPQISEPVEPTEPEEPSPPPVEPVPATLKASPDPVQLKPGVYNGSFSVANVGDQAMAWTASSKPSVALSDTGGQLAGKSSTIVSFIVDKSSLASGAFSFKIKVTGDGGTTYVDVAGFKPFDQLKPNA